MLNKNIKRAYLAGFVDGEGSISVTGRRSQKSFTITLAVYNNKRNALASIKKGFGGRLYPVRPRNKKKHAKSYQLFWRGKRLPLVLQEILPFLRIKDKQAKLAISFCEVQNIPNLDGRNSLIRKTKEYKNRFLYLQQQALKLKLLNRRGPK